MKHSVLSIITVIFLALVTQGAKASEKDFRAQLSDLKNYQVNTGTMISSGLPSQVHFKIFKEMGITKVVDLIPGDRSEESSFVKALGLAYYNIQVDWENPTVENFNEYIAAMKQNSSAEGITLTHCRLNWRGAVFTYLYRVTQLGESEEIAKRDLLDTWEPNSTWQDFIDKVKAQY